MPTELMEPRAPAAPTRTEPERDPILRGLRWIIDTPADSYLLICRLILGGVMFAHSTQKILGWFGGQGFASTLQSFRDNLGVPLVLAVLALFAEFLGSLGLILGFLGRMAAVAIIAVMVGAVLLVHLDNGFFMNWMGTNRGEGYEFHLLAIGLALPMLAKGSGAVSVDGWLDRMLRRERTENR